MENDKISKLNEQIEALNKELETVKEELEILKDEKTFNPLRVIKNKKGIKEKEQFIEEIKEKIKRKVETQTKEIQKLKKKEENKQRYENAILRLKNTFNKHTKLFVAVIIFLLIAIGSYTGISIYNSNVHDIKFFVKEDSVYIGDKLNLDFEISPKNLSINPEIELEFSDLLFEKKNDGTYFASQEGDLLVSIHYNGEMYDQKIIHINPIELKNYIVNDIDIVMNHSTDVDVEFVPSNATHVDYQLISYDDSIVKIENNKLTGVNEGTTTITISSKDNLVKNTFQVNVINVLADSIEITNDYDELIIGNSYPVRIKLSPELLSNENYELFSSNSNVINIVDNNLEAVGIGYATITAMYSNEVYCEKEIQVIYPPVEDVAITNHPKENLYVGDTYQLGMKYIPEHASNTEFEWISSDETVLKISNNGLISALGAGTAEITLRSLNGKEDHTNIKVIEKSSSVTRSNTSGTSNVDSSSSSSVNNDGSSTKMVWLSATGDCYHRINNCGRMNPNKATQVTEEYAIQHGKTACTKCNP